MRLVSLRQARLPYTIASTCFNTDATLRSKMNNFNGGNEEVHKINRYSLQNWQDTRKG